MDGSIGNGFRLKRLQAKWAVSVHSWELRSRGWIDTDALQLNNLERNCHMEKATEIKLRVVERVFANSQCPSSLPTPRLKVKNVHQFMPCLS